MSEIQSVVKQVSRHEDQAIARKGILGSCLSPCQIGAQMGMLWKH